MLTNRTPMLAAALLALAPLARAQTDFVVPVGTTVVYDTAQGPIQARNVIIEPGATLKVIGTLQPLRIRADEIVRIDGTLDLSGADGQTVAAFGIGSLPVAGGAGGPVGGLGGFGNPNTTTWSPRGGPGLTTQGLVNALAAQGGESGFNPTSIVTAHRGGGGGGGAFGPDVGFPGPPDSPLNLGRIARPGRDGFANAFGAESLASLPRGGLVSSRPFVDGLSDNDFYGRALDPITGSVIVGELATPEAGRGGGGGGNAYLAGTFPPPGPWGPGGFQRGGGGGGGGGLGIVIARRIEVRLNGRILANGGRGGAGENTNGLDRIGAGGGGGSGGMLVLQARVIDLSTVLPNALQALGGRGGAGENNVFFTVGAGGIGGPGLIQLHVPPIPGSILLQSGATLQHVSAPTAKVLLPEPGL
ncbi:MAG: hypothetical protein IPJ77_02270 [Planctomycetes bacterium]|nr:hypothetical protein [Planctomycetota bacterium]